MTQLIDRYLLYRLKIKRDPDAFAKIYDRHIESIYRFVIIKLPRKEDAQDITAETFTRLWQHLQNQKEITNLRAFLYQIARNLVADFYRNRDIISEAQTEDVTFGLDLTSNVTQTDMGRGKDQIEARTELALVLKQVDKLKDDFRDVLALRLIDGLKFSDIATILNKDVGHVRVIYHRALKAIKDLN